MSGFSWACAYAAALLLLILTALAMVGFKLQATDHWRPFFVFAGLVVPRLHHPDDAVAAANRRSPQSVHPGRNLLTAGFVRLAESVRDTSRHKDLAILLAASLFYGTGMSVVVFFASKLAEEFGFPQVDLVVFVAVITVSGIVGTILPTFLQDQHRPPALGAHSPAGLAGDGAGIRRIRAISTKLHVASRAAGDVSGLAAVADRKPAGIRPRLAGLGEPRLRRLPRPARTAKRKPSACGA